MLSKLFHKIFTLNNKPEHIRLGQKGERIAAGYLHRQAKMRILKKNYRDNTGEIDIVAQDGSELVFIEVKTRSREGCYTPEQAVDTEKQRHIIRTARRFINRYKLHNIPCRYDIVAVILNPNEKTQIRHTPNAFSPPGVYPDAHRDRGGETGRGDWEDRMKLCETETNNSTKCHSKRQKC